jgi:hypothetical protein
LHEAAILASTARKHRSRNSAENDDGATRHPEHNCAVTYRCSDGAGRRQLRVVRWTPFHFAFDATRTPEPTHTAYFASICDGFGTPFVGLLLGNGASYATCLPGGDKLLAVGSYNGNASQRTLVERYT